MTEKQYPEAIYNEEGQVAMKYLRKNRAYFKCQSGNEYVLHMRANICMGWVDEEDVPCARAVRGGCCGRKKPGVITFANEADVRRWTNGGGR